MRFGFNLFGTPIDQLVEVAATADRLGFDAAFLGDHVVRPSTVTSVYPYARTKVDDRATPIADTTPIVDVWVAIGAMAAGTERLRLATGVFVLPLRPPLLTAQAGAAAQNVSNGRFMLAVGPGWMREEFEAVGQSFDDRGPRTDEIIEILRAIWTGEPYAHKGRFYRFEGLCIQPPPSAPIPIIVGGKSRAAVRRAARLGDGFYPPPTSFEETVGLRDELDRLRADLGRSDIPFRFFAKLDGEPTPANVERYADAGFDHLTIPTNRMWSAHSPAADKAAVLERLADTLVHAHG